MKRWLIAAAALTISVAWAGEVQKKDIDLKAADGTELKGSYFSPGKSGPAILLLHQCNMDRHAWDGLAEDLAKAGFHVLTFDFRGFGDSGGHTTDATFRRSVMNEKWPGDVDTAYEYLIARNGVDKSRLAAGGASCGVTQAADLATRHHDIKALLLLSGQVSPAAKTYLESNPNLPVFGAASESDTRAAKGIQEAVGSSKDPKSDLKIYPGTEHGVPMFAKHPDLEPMIVSWLKARVEAH